jgi:hypothetical protein
MDRYSPSHAALRWLLFNTLFHGLQGLGVQRHLLRYEALASDPDGALAEALRTETAQRPSLENGKLRLAPQHTVSGNPVRFAQDLLSVELDERWKTQISPSDRRVVGALTWPLLWRYGYLTGRSR